MSDLDTWLRFIGIIFTQLVIGLGIFAGMRNTNKKVEDVGDTAQHAVDLSAPTGNGYAGKSLGALSRIEGMVGDLVRPGGRLDKIEEELRDARGVMVRHIESHAEQDVRRKSGG